MFGTMGLFHRRGAQDAYDQVHGGGIPHHEVTHDLLAGAAGFEAVRMYEHHREREGIAEHHALGKELLAGFAAAEVDKHFDSGRFGHLDRDQAPSPAAGGLPLAAAVRPVLNRRQASPATPRRRGHPGGRARYTA
jgi:hypothetical protein